MPIRIAALAVAVSLVCANSVAAQDSTAVASRDSTSHERRHFCWPGKPQAKCDGFLVTELGFTHAVVVPLVNMPYRTFNPPGEYTVPYRGSLWKVTTQVGIMANNGPKSAVGATVLFDGAEYVADLGFQLRYRRWLTPNGYALDLGGGVRRSHDKAAQLRRHLVGNYRPLERSVAYVGDISFNAKDFLALNARVDVAKIDNTMRTTVYVGARGESVLGTILAGAAMQAYIILGTLYLAAGN